MEVRGAQRGWGTVLQGLLDFEPHFCAPHKPRPSRQPPKDVATLSLTVLKDSESAARPVGRYLLHAKSYSCLWSLPLRCCVGFLLCVVFCPPSLPLK